MATFNQYQDLLTLIEAIFPNQYILTFSGGVLELKEHCPDSPMPISHILETNDMNDVLLHVWDEIFKSDKVYYKSGSSHIMLGALSIDNIKNFNIYFTVTERGSSEMKNVISKELNAAVKKKMEGKSFKLIKRLFANFNKLQQLSKK
jgi:hypothetical protein